MFNYVYIFVVYDGMMSEVSKFIIDYDMVYNLRTCLVDMAWGTMDSQDVFSIFDVFVL